ncbi:L-2-hydroxyglutarate oxidase [Microlunatus sp. Gsoil 973]|uniref:L-2-hydroxyglutarate oxidase n=1 Tax=Microlunatus sp. Gsoil 973 TaxID=2672569 RepID=UPI001E5335EB|nr:L-2-hydroxyglutarate oxidase [Microlunatus sp. Gsoil 973]
MGVKLERVAVVGGGIIGMATARELANRTDAEVTVLEKEPDIGGHQTGHNSGVVHAGLYYQPGSLKARLCRRGTELLQTFAEQAGISYDACGKLVVARTEQERPRLEAIFERSVRNGVPDVSIVDADELTAIEPEVSGVAGIHSPHTAIIDYVAVCRALAADLQRSGGRIRTGAEVTGIARTGDGVRLTTGGETEAYDLVVGCAGLQSDRLARQAGDQTDPRIVPFFGDYYLLRPERRSLVRGLVYPVPDPRYPFLGIHLTKRHDGEVMVGPNAFLAASRESYRRTAISPRDLVSAATYPGLWRFAAGNARTAIKEARRAFTRSAFIAEAQTYVPALTAADVIRGLRGIRAQAMDRTGSLIDDFVITGHGRMIFLRNAPSPGATSSLAIAEYVVDQALERVAA